jgi:4-amino-4-deoxy-L-arabinose transferase-like glycosyltransferase
MAISRKVLKSPIVWILLLTVLYFIPRLVHLTYLPIFTDEAIYIRWSQIGGNDASWRFISLTDGKQPLFTWLVMIALRMFRDPLFAGRFVSVGAGFLSLIGMYFLGSEMFKNKRIGLLASILYLFSPFTVMYDRLALYDSLVATFFIWNLYLAVLLVRRVRMDVALILGLTLGAGMLNKTSAFFSLYLLPVTVILFDWKKTKLFKRLGIWIGLCVVSAILSQMVYAILRLSPYFYIISQKDTLFVYPLREWITHPFNFFQGNFHGLFDWFITYITWPVFLGAVFSVFVFSKKPLEKILLFGEWAAPFVALALFGKVLYPRFVLFMAMPILVLAAYTLNWIIDSVRSKWLKIALYILILLPGLVLSYRILTDITHAPIAHGDIGQLVNDWPSGWGVGQVVSFLKDQSREGPLTVYTEGTFGLFPYALEIYTIGNNNIQIHGLWPTPLKLPESIKASAMKMPTYFVANLTQTPPDWPLKLLATYQKGSNQNSAMHLYQVTLPKEK